MNWIKRIVISLAILVVVGIGGFVLYHVAYARGDTVGYSRGYSAGQEIGYSSGEQDGYNEGYVSGKGAGYDEGYDLGKADGYEEGYDEGMQAGLGHGYTLRDPTYKQAVSFLKRDKTDENEYIEDTYGVYVCSHFARDVCNNAEAEGLRCALVSLIYLEGGHAIIAFDTIDEGLVYFDAMTDERTKPVVGERYYQCIEPRPGYYYVEPDFDDTIMDILVIW
jgi:hypothetical protein